MKRLVWFISIYVVFTLNFQGQGLIDDSTQTNLNFSQTKYFTKHDVKVGDSIRRNIFEGQRFDFFQFSQNDSIQLFDLGFYGAAAYNWLKPYNSRLGYFDGITSYDHLSYQDEKVKYYDTKVPFSFAEYRKIASSTEFVRAGYAQSMGKLANIGTEVTRFATPLNFGTNPNRTAMNSNFSVLTHGSFISKTGKYKILANYRFMKHETSETGGIDFDTLSRSVFDSLVVEQFISQNLSSAKTEDKRNEWDIYQELSPFKKGQIKLFHELSRTKKVNSFTDTDIKTDSNYYSYRLQSKETTKDSNVFRVIENKVGLNGTLNQISYSAFVKNRYWKYESDTNRTDTATLIINRKSDLFGGGSLFYQTKDRSIFSQLNFEVGFKDTRKFEFISDFKYLKFSYLDLKNNPYLRQLSFDENHGKWSNNFDSYVVKEIKIEPYYNGKNIRLKAFFNSWNYSNFIYYRSIDFKPYQDSIRRNGYAMGADVQYFWKKRWIFGQFAQYNAVKDIPFLAVPEFYTHTNIQYSMKIKKLPSLKILLGTDIFYTGKFKPLAYRSDIQQFVVDGIYEQKDFLMLDAFANFRYKTVSVSVKANNLLQGLIGSPLMMPVLDYHSKKRKFEIGVRWSFFR